MINKIKTGKEQNKMIDERAITKAAVIGKQKRKFNNLLETLCVWLCVCVWEGAFGV